MTVASLVDNMREEGQRWLRHVKKDEQMYQRGGVRCWPKKSRGKGIAHLQQTEDMTIER